MTAASYTLAEGAQHVSCEFLRAELQRFEVSLVNQLRNEMLQCSLSKHRQVSIKSIDDCEHQVLPLRGETGSTGITPSGKPESSGSTQARIMEDDGAILIDSGKSSVKNSGRQDSIGHLVKTRSTSIQRMVSPNTRDGDLLASCSKTSGSFSSGQTELPGRMQASIVEGQSSLHSCRETVAPDPDNSDLHLPSTKTISAQDSDGDNLITDSPGKKHLSERPNLLTGLRTYMQRGRTRNIRSTENLACGGKQKREPSNKQRALQSQAIKYWRDNFSKLAVIGESTIVFSIILNGLFYGVQTDYMAQHGTENVPEWCVILEQIFCCIFTVELVARVATHKCRFFSMEDRLWQWFDGSLVFISWVDVILETYANTQVTQGTQSMVKNMTYMRWLRMLRILRVLRIARLLKFMGDLNVVFSAIGKSIKSLVSTLVILMGILYIFAISFTQVSTSRRSVVLEEHDADDEDLKRWWGSLGRSMLSLFQSVFGGVDWDDVVVPLMSINTVLGVLFSAYIGFMVLAIMNVVTACIVDAAIANGRKVKDKAFKNHVRQFFIACDRDESGHITKQEMEACMESDYVSSTMVEMGIDFQDVDMLFQYLDHDGSNSIDPEELLVGLVRLRAGTKFIDIMTLLHELDLLKVALSEGMHKMRKENRAILDELKSQSLRNIATGSWTHSSMLGTQETEPPLVT